MINNYKVTLENITQLATLLLQALGLFILKPNIYNFQNTGELFAGGNFYNFILIFISITFLILANTYEEYKFTYKWFLAFLISSIAFIVCFFYYNNAIETKTILFPLNANSSAVRLIKGNRFSSDIIICANDFKKEHPDISEIEIIKTCSDITSVIKLLNVWPEREIKDNIRYINILYCICISLASVALICGLQSLKCKKIET